MEIGYSVLLKELSSFIILLATKMWLHYDGDADVMYVSFEERPSSTHSEMTDEGVILDYRDDTLVGLTILDASRWERETP